MSEVESVEYPSHYLAATRVRQPLIHNITNFVAMNTMANVLLAVGASPAMVHATEEVAEFAALADALTVNIGTADSDWYASMEVAAQVMNSKGRAWVLDPVGVGATRFRQEGCSKLLALCPTVIRGNASEIMALAGVNSTARGVDSNDEVGAAEAFACDLAGQTGGVIAVSGPIDFITDGNRGYYVKNGTVMMTQVTTMGCALNGIIAAFCVDNLPLEATVAALVVYGVAGEQATANSQGPGTFFPAFLDALACLSSEKLDAASRVTQV